jgi:hypothetical protein
MVGLPQIMTFWITPYFYPILDDDPKYQHYFMLGLTAWLITIGPKESLFMWVLSFMPNKVQAMVKGLAAKVKVKLD